MVSIHLCDNANCLSAKPCSVAAPYSFAPAGEARFSMVRSERTAGFIPSYDSLFSGSRRFEARPHQDKAFAALIEKTAAGHDDTVRLDNKVPEKCALEQDEGQYFDIFDCVDMVNPLQHIPVLSHIYRALTGDNIKPISSIMGGAIFGGPAGAAYGLVTAVLEGSTGKPVHESLRSIAFGEERFEQNLMAYETRSNRIGANYDYNV